MFVIFTLIFKAAFEQIICENSIIIILCSFQFICIIGRVVYLSGLFKALIMLFTLEETPFYKNGVPEAEKVLMRFYCY